MRKEMNSFGEALEKSNKLLQLEEKRNILVKKANELGFFEGTKEWKKLAEFCEDFLELKTEYEIQARQGKCE